VASHPPIGDQVPRDDPDWIPYVARAGWVVITNDKRIRTRPTEAPDAIKYGLRCAHIEAGKDALVWVSLRLLLRHWDEVEALAPRQGPLWLQLHYRHAPRELSYQPGKPPRLTADEREARVRAARHPQRPSAPHTPSADPGQNSLPF
jgi:hypothetical protein